MLKLNNTNEAVSRFSLELKYFYMVVKKVDDDEIIYYSENVVEVTGYTGEELRIFRVEFSNSC